MSLKLFKFYLCAKFLQSYQLWLYPVTYKSIQAVWSFCIEYYHVLFILKLDCFSAIFSVSKTDMQCHFQERIWNCWEWRSLGGTLSKCIDSWWGGGESTDGARQSQWCSESLYEFFFACWLQFLVMLQTVDRTALCI